MGFTGTVPLLWANLVAAVLLVVPVTIVLARLESSVKEGTLGKHTRHLRVVSARTGARVSFQQAIARNALKIALPWTIGHAAVYGIVTSSATGAVPISIWVLTAIAYVLPITYVVSLFLGTGKTLNRPGFRAAFFLVKGCVSCLRNSLRRFAIEPFG